MISASERSKKWRKDNPERIKEYNEKNKERFEKLRKEDYHKNRKLILKKKKEWRKNNQKTKAKYNKKYRDNNKDSIKEYNANYTKRNPHKLKEAHNKRNFNGLRIKALERDGYKCQKCGLTEEEHIRKWGCSLIVHHKDGVGRDTKKPNNKIDNLQTLCKICHGKEHGKKKFLFRGNSE